MIDSTTVAAVGNIPPGNIALQTILIVAVLEGISLVKKYGPGIIAWLRTGQSAKSTAAHVCTQHQDMMSAVQENTLVVKDLTKRADRHHQEQREDIDRLKVTVETDLRELRKCVSISDRQIAEHETAISFLREKFA